MRNRLGPSRKRNSFSSPNTVAREIRDQRLGVQGPKFTNPRTFSSSPVPLGYHVRVFACCVARLSLSRTHGRPIEVLECQQFHSLLGFRGAGTSLTLKLNAPSTFLNNFLCAFHRTEHAASPFRFPLAHNRIKSATFLLHKSEGVCARGRQHRSLFPPERIDDHSSIFPFLNQFCPIGTAGYGDDE